MVPKMLPVMTSLRKCCPRYIREIPTETASIKKITPSSFFCLDWSARSAKILKAAMVCPDGKLECPINKSTPSTGINSSSRPSWSKYKTGRACRKNSLEVPAIINVSAIAQGSSELNITNFTRKAGKKDASDLFNSYLDNANYLAYGLASVVLWVLGLPFQMAVSHGKTRRGALVFDVADIIKDGIIMPVAMMAANEDMPRNKMRKQCIKELHKSKALDYLFAKLIQIVEEKY